MLLFLNTCSLLAYVVSCWLVIRRLPRSAALLWYLLGMQCWSLLSCWYNDLGVFNLELFRNTDPSAATSALALAYGLFNLGLFASAAMTSGRSWSTTTYRLPDAFGRLVSGSLVARGLTLLLLIPLWWTFVTEGVPVMQGIHKALYAEESGALGSLLLSYGFIPVFLLGCYRKRSNGIELNDLFVGALMLTQVGAGNKFSSLLLLAASYAAPVIARASHEQVMQITGLRQLGRVCAVAVLFLGLSYTSYALWDEDAELAQYVLADRVLANQGHLWWGTFDLIQSNHAFHPEQWSRELDAVIAPNQSARGSSGMSYLMVELLGAEKAFAIFDTGYLYTMAWPAVLLPMLPYWGVLLVQLFLGVIMGAALWNLSELVRTGAIIRALLVLTIVIPAITMLFSGSFATLLTVGIVLKVFIIIWCEIGIPVPGRREHVAVVTHSI